MPSGGIEEMNLDFQIKSGKVLLDFYAPWCAPCKQLDPLLDRVPLKVIKINVDEHPEIAGQYDVRGLPTVIVMEDGVEAVRFTGNKVAERLRDL